VLHDDDQIRTDYAGAEAVNRHCGIRRRADAQRKVESLYGVSGAQRHLYHTSIIRGMYEAEIGDPVELMLPRWALASGENAFCAGFDYDLGEASSIPSASLDLLGSFLPSGA